MSDKSTVACFKVLSQHLSQVIDMKYEHQDSQSPR